MQKFDKKLLKLPSFFATALTGLIMVAILLTVMFSWSKVKNFTLYEKIIVSALFGMVIGVHGLLHLGMEATYHFNPLSDDKLKKLE